MEESKFESQFAEPVSSKEIAELWQSAIPQKTQKNTARGHWAALRQNNLRDDEESIKRGATFDEFCANDF